MIIQSNLPKYITLLLSVVFLSFQCNSQAFVKDYACTVIETEARFRDTINGWDNYLKQNITSVIPIRNCAPSGSYKVEIRFLIGKDGILSDVKAMTANGYGMEAEVIRVIEHSPQWIPATRNGRKVRAYKRQSFVFTVSNQL